MKRYIDAAAPKAVKAPAAKPSATAIPAATGGKASFGRKRQAEEEVAGQAAPPQAKAPKAPVKAAPF